MQCISCPLILGKASLWCLRLILNLITCTNLGYLKFWQPARFRIYRLLVAVGWGKTSWIKVCGRSPGSWGTREQNRGTWNRLRHHGARNKIMVGTSWGQFSATSFLQLPERKHRTKPRWQRCTLDLDGKNHTPNGGKRELSTNRATWWAEELAEITVKCKNEI